MYVHVERQYNVLYGDRPSNYHIIFYHHNIRLEIPLAPAVTVNLAQVPEMAQEKIDQSLDPALLEHLVKRNFKILQNDPYLLAIEELHGMVRT